MSVSTSISSSSVPTPPGSVTKPLLSRSMVALRSCISFVTIISLQCSNGMPGWFSFSGITPTVLPPFEYTPRAHAPISPVRPPPNIRSNPCSARQRPKLSAAAIYLSSILGEDAANMHMPAIGVYPPYHHYFITKYTI